jgi:peptide deformylase
MHALLVRENALGIASTQMGAHERVIMTQFGTFFNPVIMHWSPLMVLGEEGCLSLPGLVSHVKRSTNVSLKYVTWAGKKGRSMFEGMQARIIQHEVDHLNGTLMTDREIANV